MIVVADDLGAEAGRNAAITRALSSGLVDAASAMANGAAFAEAAELVRPFAGRIGVHLVLTDGVPLTDGIRSLRRFCDGDGCFRLWRGSERAFRLDGRERGAVAQELRAQIECVRSGGLTVAHLDSHHHVHTEPAIAGIVIALARESAVPRIRLARNCGAGMSPVNRIWKAIYNGRLRRAGFAGTHWFGSLDDYRHLHARRADVEDFELMVHPLLSSEGVVADEEAASVPLAERLAAAGVLR